MSYEFHWGGIDLKGLFKAVILDIWMVFVVMVIMYLGLGVAENIRNTPSYTSSSVIAVYPLNKMYTLEAPSGALETVSAVNEVLNSEMFKTGLKDHLEEPVDFSLYSQQIDRTYILMLSVSSSSPESAYQILRTALDYYEEIASHLVGNSHLEILSEPDFPTSASSDTKILKYRNILTLIAGFAMAGFLILMYTMRKTYKTSSAIQKYYKDLRFFNITLSSSNEHSFWNRRKSSSLSNHKSMRKTSLELMQMLRTKSGKSIFITSATHNEGKTEIIVSFARVGFGKSVIIIETNSENIEISKQLGISENQLGYTLPELLQEEVNLESAVVDATDQNIKVLFIRKVNTYDDFSYSMEDVEKILLQAEKLSDVILINGCIWTDFSDELNWKEVADTSLVICRKDKADFFNIDQMITDLQENNPCLLGCVLYGF